MINLIEVRTDEERLALRDLPIVVELIEKEQKRYFFIENYRDFYDDYPSPHETHELYPSYEVMKKLSEKHGIEISSEQFEKGKVMPAIIKKTGDVSYTEYRFKLGEENGESKEIWKGHPE